MIPVDVEIADTSNGNLCECCGQHNIMCMCTVIGGRKKQLPECNCVSCLKEVCVEALAGAIAGDFEDILAEEGTVRENGTYINKKSIQAPKTPPPIKKSDEESPVKKVILNVQNMTQTQGLPILKSPVKKNKEKDPVITKKVAQSIPQPTVIKIDKSPSFDHTLKEIKAQTSAYARDARLKTDSNLDRHEKGDKLPNQSCNSRKDRKSPIKTSKREKEVKPLSNSNCSEETKKMVVQHIDTSKQQRKRKVEEIRTGASCTIQNSKDGRQIKKITMCSQAGEDSGDDGDGDSKKKIEIEIQIPLKTAEVPKQNSFELNEKFVKENPDLLKRIITALENNDNIHSVNMMTDDAKSKFKKEALTPLDKIEGQLFLTSEKVEKTKKKKGKIPCCKDGHVCHNFVPVTPEDIIKAGQRVEEKLKQDKLKETTEKGRNGQVLQTEETAEMSVSLKETEKSFSIIKQTTKKTGEKGNLINKILEEAEENIIFEEYDDGMKADIIMMGEPQCPCQAKVKELMKEKLKKINKKQEEQTTLKKELSHRFHCPEQLSVREEKTSLTSSRPPCLSNDPNIDINDIIEEQLMDSFNIKKLCNLGMKIWQNCSTQTYNDGEGGKNLGFKERIITCKPWTDERSKCVKEPDPNLQGYLKQIDYKQETRVDVGTQAEEIIDTKMQRDGKEKENVKENFKETGHMDKNTYSSTVISKLRKCACCEVVEPAPKTFHKCQK